MSRLTTILLFCRIVELTITITITNSKIAELTITITITNSRIVELTITITITISNSNSDSFYSCLTIIIVTLTTIRSKTEPVSRIDR
jgi:hypothetical protein